MFQDLQSPALCGYSNLNLSSECIYMYANMERRNKLIVLIQIVDSILLHAIVNSESTTTGSTSTYCTMKYRLLELLLVII